MTFKEYHEKMKSLSEQESFILFNEFKNEQKIQEQKGFEYLTESENAQIDKYIDLFENEYNSDLSKLDEAFIKKILGLNEDEILDEGFFGGVVGLVAGSAISKAVCRVLGISQGIIYDTLTSKLCSIALFSAIGDAMSKNKK